MDSHRLVLEPMEHINGAGLRRHEQGAIPSESSVRPVQVPYIPEPVERRRSVAEDVPHRS